MEKSRIDEVYYEQCLQRSADDSSPRTGRALRIYETVLNGAEDVRMDALMSAMIITLYDGTILVYDYKKDIILKESEKIRRGGKYLMKLFNAE